MEQQTLMPEERSRRSRSKSHGRSRSTSAEVTARDRRALSDVGLMNGKYLFYIEAGGCREAKSFKPSKVKEHVLRHSLRGALMFL